MRLWEIREKDEQSRDHGYRSGMRGYREDERDRAYECGYEDGYRDAMKEAKSYYGEKISRKGSYRDE